MRVTRRPGSGGVKIVPLKISISSAVSLKALSHVARSPRLLVSTARSASHLLLWRVCALVARGERARLGGIHAIRLRNDAVRAMHVCCFDSCFESCLRMKMESGRLFRATLRIRLHLTHLSRTFLNWMHGDVGRPSRMMSE